LNCSVEMKSIVALAAVLVLVVLFAPAIEAMSDIGFGMLLGAVGFLVLLALLDLWRGGR